VLTELQALCGLERGVIYSVPFAARPQPRRGYFRYRGSEEWQQFLTQREAVDIGEPAFIVSLRPLDDREAALVIDWGNTYSNAFILVQPQHADCDLSEPSNSWAKELERLTHEPTEVPDGSRRIAAFLRLVYGTWICWPETDANGHTLRVPLSVGPDETLWHRVLHEMRSMYPQAAFDAAVERLYRSDRELFHGAVAGLRSVFRTRLGLPFLYEPRMVDRGVRPLAATARVHLRAPDMRAPLQDDVAEELFERCEFG
jgi:hypothetical protein